jgi:CBS domain-containing protein
MKVEDIVRVKGAGVFTLPADEPIAVAAKHMMEQRIGAVVVCDGEGRPRGVLSERDVVHGLASHGREVLGMPIRALMQAEVLACNPLDSLLKLMALMTDRRMRHVPVTDGDGRLCGIVSIGDAVKARMEEFEAEARALRDYISMS